MKKFASIVSLHLKKGKTSDRDHKGSEAVRTYSTSITIQGNIFDLPSQRHLTQPISSNRYSSRKSLLDGPQYAWAVQLPQ